MMDFYKKTIYWVATVFLVVLMVFVLVSISQKLNTATTTNTVSFSGEGKVSAKPDIAVASITILTEAATSKKAQDDNSAKSNTVVDFLKKQGVEEKDIKTGSYNIYPKYSYPRPVPVPLSPVMEGQSRPDYYDSNPKITGYQVNQTIEVKVRDLNKASQILDGVVAAGANQVNNFSFQIENPEKLKDQARELAIKDAKEKADTLKSQLGVRLGRIINFSENSYGFPVYLEAKADAGGGGYGGGPSLPEGENEITINVTITYQIK